ncbi:MAG: mycothiol synthase [Promicromonosporaceae bacterium]|nr:mycothiol synthase [Promicromonosporaceae bacterium]
MRFPPPLAIGPLMPEEAGAVRTLAAAAEAADGVAPLSEATLLRLGDDTPTLTHVRALSRTGTLEGYLLLDRGALAASAELVVHPGRRGGGVGSALLRIAERDVRYPLTGGDGAAAAQPLRLWAHGDLPTARHFAARHGYQVARELLLLERPRPGGAHPATEPPARGGFRFRTFRPDVDGEAWVQVNAKAFAAHPEQGRLTIADLRQRLAEPWFDAAGFFVAEPLEAGPSSSLAGFAWTKRHAETARQPARGEIYALGIDPASGGQGLGQALLTCALGYLDRYEEVTRLYVDGDNTAARGLYRKFGFEEIGRDVQYAQPVQAALPVEQSGHGRRGKA